MQILKAAGGFFLWLAVMSGAVFLVAALFAGIVAASAQAFFYLTWIWQTALLLSIFIFLPLAIFRATRMAAAFGLLGVSFAFGACVWIFGLIVTWSYWGLWVAFIGICFIGVGVVPLGIIASAFHSDWIAIATIARAPPIS